MAKRNRKSTGAGIEAAEPSGSTKLSRTERRDHLSGRNHVDTGPAGFAHRRDLAMAAFIGSHPTLAPDDIALSAPQQRPVPQGLSDPACGGMFAYAGAATGWANAIDILRCRVVLRLVTELFEAALEHELANGVARRRPRCHMRQIAMYLSHVVLSVPYRTIAKAFGRDRTTVVHACAVVEDRRDDLGYDRFVERCERCVKAVFAPFGGSHEER
ncbi:helix-turn-helix domain-containing protein [Hoeflea sp.]|uniref:helix-turn-helix domain-containing protein n=1 Tax=Hoeflea sp. TaxID=1940281 RepID=UPI003748D4A8